MNPKFKNEYEYFVFDMLHSMEDQVVYEAVKSIDDNNLSLSPEWVIETLTNLARDYRRWTEIRLYSLRILARAILSPDVIKTFIDALRELSEDTEIRSFVFFKLRPHADRPAVQTAFDELLEKHKQQESLRNQPYTFIRIDPVADIVGKYWKIQKGV